jgi:hypothetical protein
MLILLNIVLDRIDGIFWIFFAFGDTPFDRGPLYPNNPVDPV